MIRSKITYIDFNPDNKFWVHDEVLTSKNAEFLVLTYEDNEGLSPETLEDLLEKKDKAFFNPNLSNPEIFNDKNIKSEYWANWCKVYIFGEIGNLEGIIFTNWKIIDTLPDKAKYVRSGLDFGFTNDPTTCIDKYVYEGQPIYDEILYEKGLTNGAIAKLVSEGFKRKIIADSSEPKSITEIKGYRVDIVGAVKGSDSVKFGIQTLQNEEFLVTARSLNLINELRKYRWVKSKDGKNVNVPIDAFNHCFVGSTLIETISGSKRIDQIKEGDIVFTSNGLNKVLKAFNNGIKETIELSLQFDTFLLSLQCTEDHKIKTTEGWIKAKNLTEKHIVYTKEKNIIAEEQSDCIELFGNIITEKYQMDSIYTTSTKTHQITELKICKWLKEENIFQLTSKYFTQSILNSLLSKSKRIKISAVLGMRLQRVLSNIENKLLKVDLEILRTEKENAMFAKNNSQHNTIYKGFAQTIVKANLEGYQELITKKESVKIAELNLKSINIQEQKIVAVRVVKKGSEKVYDLMIENEHEYFANGLLVHNCIDPMRYINEQDVLSPKVKRKGGGVIS